MAKFSKFVLAIKVLFLLPYHAHCIIARVPRRNWKSWPRALTVLVKEVTLIYGQRCSSDPRYSLSTKRDMTLPSQATNESKTLQMRGSR